MPKWQDYQERAAEFFRDLGMSADTDQSIKGVRGSHRVDVVARLDQAWGTQLWIVECKLWRRRVGKLHVAALADIVTDIGADRGFLLSESGFQSGAIRHARQRNVTLTSLEDLRENASEEIDERALSIARQRMERLRARLIKADELDRTHTPVERGGFWVPSEENTRLRGQLGFAEMSLPSAVLGKWPVLYGADLVKDEGLFAENLDELARALPDVLDAVEAGIEQLEGDLTKDDLG